MKLMKQGRGRARRPMALPFRISSAANGLVARPSPGQAVALAVVGHGCAAPSPLARRAGCDLEPPPPSGAAIHPRRPGGATLCLSGCRSLRFPRRMAGAASGRDNCRSAVPRSVNFLNFEISCVIIPVVPLLACSPRDRWSKNAGIPAAAMKIRELRCPVDGPRFAPDSTRV